MNRLDADPRLKDKTYVVGVGVQKAGTSWLHNFLHQQPNIFMSERKEIHYFDTRFEVRKTSIQALLIRQLRRQLDLIVEDETFHYNEKLTEILDMLRMFYDDYGYPAYFASRVGDRPLFGEITPSYCLIGEEGFRYMKGMFPRIKVIYLLRDPIDRHYSMLRMNEDRRGESGFATRNFLPNLDKELSQSRANYPEQIEALKSVFSDDELFIGFYETLFNQKEIYRLCDFLGIPRASADFDTRINSSRAGSGLDPALVSAARERLAPTYDYCRSAFSDLPASWRA